MKTAVLTFALFTLFVAPAFAAPPQSLSARAELAKMEAALKASTGVTYESTITLGGIGSTGGLKVLHVVATLEKPNKALFLISPVDNGQERIFADGADVTVFDSKNSTFSTVPAAPSLQGSLSSFYRASQAVFTKQPDAVSNLTWLMTFPISYSIGDFEPGAVPAGTVLDLTTTQSSLGGKPMTVVAQNYRMVKYNISFSVSYAIDRKTHLPLELDEASVSDGGQLLNSIRETFQDFKILRTPLVKSTYAFSPPDSGALLPAPAPPVTNTASAAPPSKLLAAGTPAPDFSVLSSTGQPVKLSDFAGKVVVLDFWSTWATPCVASLLHTDDLAKLYVSKGVQFLPICSWDAVSAFNSWLDDHTNMTMSFYFDPAAQRSAASVASRQYAVDGLPTQYVIGKDGKVVASFVGYDATGDPEESALALAIGRALNVTSNAQP